MNIETLGRSIVISTDNQSLELGDSALEWKYKLFIESNSRNHLAFWIDHEGNITIYGGNADINYIVSCGIFIIKKVML